MYGVLFWPLHGFILDFWQKGAYLSFPFNETNMRGLLIGLIPWLEKGTHEDYIFTENIFKFISCCFLIIKSTRFQ